MVGQTYSNNTDSVVKQKRLAVLGSTGSIGTQTLDIVSKKSDSFKVVALAAYKNAETLLGQARKFDAKYVALGDEYAIDQAKMLASNLGCTIGVGAKSVVDLVYCDEVDTVVNALSGAAGLLASYETLKAGKQLALANKESLVIGGDLLMPLVYEMNSQRVCNDVLMPIDSEHSAIFQCLSGEDAKGVSCFWITASGGPFYNMTKKQLSDVTPTQALAHPTWKMGPKISVDSSTLMNKGLEVIEAHHLFGLPYDKIKVVIHPQSVIHSMVEFVDGSIKAHLGPADMRIPILYALSYPKRFDARICPLDFYTLGSIDFNTPDKNTFGCLNLAYAAGRQGGTLPCAMNAANEVVVAAFLAGRCGYLDIEACVDASMDEHVRRGCSEVESIEQLQAVDTQIRAFAHSWLVKNS